MPDSNLADRGEIETDVLRIFADPNGAMRDAHGLAAPQLNSWQ
jgi:hypothetical protein